MAVNLYRYFFYLPFFFKIVFIHIFSTRLNHFFNRLAMFCTCDKIICYIVQFIGVLPRFFKYSLALEKCLHPINPLCADNGEGCEAERM